MLVTFGQEEFKKTIKIPFMVIDSSSLYNCIIWRTWMAQLGAACSTSHLKLKYHAKNDTITTLHGDIEAARRCFVQTNKNHSLVSLTEQSSEGTFDSQYRIETRYDIKLNRDTI